jgi:tetratricopeptide (TPR) repeat protein
VAIDRTDADAWYQLGLAQLGAGAPAKAVAAQRQAVTFIPTEWADPYAAMAEAYTAMADRDHAEYARAMVDLVNKSYDVARDRFLPLVDGVAGQDAAIGLGLVAEKTGKQADAIAWYRKALELDPDSIAASWGLSRMGIEVTRASAAPSEAPSSGNG